MNLNLENKSLKKFTPLTEEVIHLYLVPLDITAAREDELCDVLSDEEKKRAEQFKFLHLKKRFIAAQGELRLLLSRYLSQTPESIIIERTKYGKPYLQTNTAFKFNLSHAGDYMLCGFALNSEIGMDLELIRNNYSWKKISQRFFHATEAEYLQALPREQQQRDFFKLWVKKEAFIKAIGLGLFCALDKFQVMPQTTQQIVWNNSIWSLQEVPLCASYVAAVSNEGKTKRIIFLDRRVKREPHNYND